MKETAIRTRGKTRTGLRHRVYAFALAMLALLAFTAGASYAAAPQVNSRIGNTATASYTDPIAGTKTATSNEVVTWVQQVPGLTLTIDNQTKSISVGGTIYFMHTVTNTGNGPDTFTLSAAKSSGAGTITVPTTIYADTGSGPGSTLSPAQTTTLATNGTFNFWYAVNASGSALITDTADILVTATSQFGAHPSATNTDHVTVSPFANVAVNKYIDSVTGPTGPVGSQVMTINYRIHYVNNGSNTANAFTITDPMPAGTTYVLTSGRWSTTGATVLTDLDKTDAQGTAPNTIIYDWNVSTPGKITAVINQILTGANGDLTFQVTFPVATAPGSTFTNTAHYTYDDGGGHNPSGDATVVYTIPTVLGVVLDDIGSTNDSDGHHTVGDTNDTVTIASAPQGGVVWFDNVIHNTGNVADTYALSYSGSTFPASTIQYYDAQGGSIITGGVTPSVAAGGTYHVWVKVILNMNASGNNGGAGYTLLLRAQSSTNGAIFDTDTDKLLTIAPAIMDITNNLPYNLGTPAPGQGISDGSGPAITTTSGSSIAPAVFALYLNNIGATDETYVMSYSATIPFATALPAGWTVDFRANGTGVCATTGSSLSGNTTPTITAGSNLLVCAVVTPPAGATGGLTQDVYFKAAGSNTGVFDIKHDAVTTARGYAITIIPNNTGQIVPNGAKVYSHTVTNNSNVAVAKTAGDLIFSTIDSKAGWTSILYYDSNSNGIFDGGDAVLTDLNQIVGPAGLAPGASVTIFVKVQAPATALGDQDTTTINLTSTKSLPIPKIVASATDTTTMQAAQLTIEKYQALDTNCTLNTAGARAGASYVQSEITSGANPGSCLHYKLVVTNGGNQPATSLQVTDLMPPYTFYYEGANCPAGGGSMGANGTITDTGVIGTASITQPTQCNTFGSIVFGPAGNFLTLNAGQVATLYFSVQITH